jgi:hypothetical protein
LYAGLIANINNPHTSAIYAKKAGMILNDSVRILLTSAWYNGFAPKIIQVKSTNKKTPNVDKYNKILFLAI